MKLLKAEFKPYTYNGGGYDILCTFEGDYKKNSEEYFSAPFEERMGIYRADVGDVVRYFSWTGPGDGYGGRVFDITMINGEKKSLKGPWSSRAGVVNRLFGEMDHIIECIDVSDGHRTTIDVKIPALCRVRPDVLWRVREDSRSDFVWQPVL